jgi:hypothetical protein
VYDAVPAAFIFDVISSPVVPGVARAFHDRMRIFSKTRSGM